MKLMNAMLLALAFALAGLVSVAEAQAPSAPYAEVYAQALEDARAEAADADADDWAELGLEEDGDPLDDLEEADEFDEDGDVEAPEPGEEPAAPTEEPVEPPRRAPPRERAELESPAREDDDVERAPPNAIRLNFRDVPLEAVLQHLSQIAGVSVVTDIPIDGRITLISREALPLDQALALLDSALKEKGYATLRVGNTLKILSIASAKRASIPVYAGNDPRRIEVSDQMITQVIPLRTVDASRLRDSLQSLIPEYAELGVDASSNSLILTDTSANVRRIVEIVASLDASKELVSEVRVFPLMYADAVSAARLINQIFELDQPTTDRRQQAVTRFAAMARGRRPDAQADEGAFSPQKTVAAADERTNTIVVSGPSSTLDVVENVLRELDSDPQVEQDVLIYHLNNANAESVAGVLENLFAQQATQATARTAAARTAATRRGARDTGATAQTATVSALAGEVRIVANADTNTLLVIAAPRFFDRLNQIIAELDRPVPQVLIKALIAEVTHDDELDLGVELSALNMLGGDSNIDLLTNFGLSAEDRGFIMRFAQDEHDLGATVRMLQVAGKLEILSRPYVLASDNQEATIIVGSEVPFITQTRTTETGQTINTITYEDIGIILRVTPHINTEGLVIMDVSPEISSLTGQTVPISEAVNAEVFAKRAATSRVAIRDGQTIVIGGLMEDRETENVRKVPLLGDIPLLGALFRRTIRRSAKTELLIFLTPRVARRPEDMEAISREEEALRQLVPDAIAPGAFDRYMREMGNRPPE